MCNVCATDTNCTEYSTKIINVLVPCKSNLIIILYQGKKFCTVKCSLSLLSWQVASVCGSRKLRPDFIVNTCWQRPCVIPSKGPKNPPN